MVAFWSLYPYIYIYMSTTLPDLHTTCNTIDFQEGNYYCSFLCINSSTLHSIFTTPHSIILLHLDISVPLPQIFDSHCNVATTSSKFDVSHPCNLIGIWLTSSSNSAWYTFAMFSFIRILFHEYAVRIWKYVIFWILFHSPFICFLSVIQKS